MTTVRFNVWIHTDDIDSMDFNLFERIPGFIESSFEDSYEEG